MKHKKNILWLAVSLCTFSLMHGGEGVSQMEQKVKVASVAGEKLEGEKKSNRAMLVYVGGKVGWRPKSCVTKHDQYPCISFETALEKVGKESFFRIYEALPKWLNKRTESSETIQAFYSEDDVPNLVKYAQEPGASHEVRITVASLAYAEWMMDNVVLRAFDKADQCDGEYTFACMNACVQDDIAVSETVSLDRHHLVTWAQTFQVLEKYKGK